MAGQLGTLRTLNKVVSTKIRRQKWYFCARKQPMDESHG